MNNNTQQTAAQAENSKDTEEYIRLSSERAEELVSQYGKEAKLPSGFSFENGNLMFLPDSKGEDDIPSPVFICSRLDVTACTRDHIHENHGRLLEFVDVDGHQKQWAMPMELLAGSGEEYRRVLLSMGLQIAPGMKPRNLLTTYIQSSKPQARIRCVPHTGWHDSCFVLPNETVGSCGTEKVILQAAAPNFPDYAIAGTLDEWRANISALCIGNSLLTFSVSIAFAPILLALLGAESGGFHFRGESSTGKTTALSVAASVWGGKEHIQTWRNTLNGMEALAAGHNDALLCLDELAQIDPSEVGEAVYMLANGSGKGRASRRGDSRKKARWRSIFFSTGEISLETHMNEAGKKVRGGQAVRIVDIPADTHKYKLFEILHGYANGHLFSDALTQACRTYHGTASREFLKRILEKKAEIPALVKAYKEGLMAVVSPSSDVDGQVHRVAGRFALVAVAGELATRFGITGWSEKDAFYAARSCFVDWLKDRGGTGSQEERAILSQVRRFFEQNGESRFSFWEAPQEFKTINRAGFRKKDEEGAVEFFVFPETFKQEVAAGFDPAIVAKVCLKHRLIKEGSKGEPTRSERLPGMNANTRCYRFTAKVLSDEEAG